MLYLSVIYSPFCKGLFSLFFCDLCCGSVFYHVPASFNMIDILLLRTFKQAFCGGGRNETNVQPAACMRPSWCFPLLCVEYNDNLSLRSCSSLKFDNFDAMVLSTCLSRTAYWQISTCQLTPRCKYDFWFLLCTELISNYLCCSIGIKFAYDITVWEWFKK